ncbi:multidrug transporter [Burkholderia mallei]|nr:multidrug transporter [Burkholderia mallei]EDK55206.1 outer membrane efflux protein OprB [Burkholderia mallei FMH]EDK61193.1 outer membrane efflux protein OprB [Burkholderia mallei JHU]ATE00780.1 multidrug transporter [Burkholderia mallei]ATE05702.1 multidrug transporter [Burkholderia mallei]
MMDRFPHDTAAASRRCRRRAGGAARASCASCAASRVACASLVRTAVRAAAVAAAFFAAGCTLAPRYERPAAPVSGAFPADGVYAAQPGAAPGARSANGQAAVDIGWREFFVDPRLQRLIEIALKNNRDLRVSVLNVEASRAQYQITRAGLFPTLSGTGTGTIQRTPAGVSITGQPLISRTYNVGVSASWELDLFGRVQSLKDQALAQYFATAQARKAAEISLVASVADQYLTLLSTDDLLQVTQNTLKSARASYDLTKLQFDNGTGSELDLRQAQTVVETALASQQAQARARAQALNALVLLIGEPLPDDLPADLPLNAQNLLTDIPAGLPSDLLTRRPDIMQAEETLRAANANIGAARAAFFPKISLTSAFGTASTTLGGLFKAGTAAWSFAPNIALPIFEGGQNIANLDLAHVQKRIEIANYEKAIQSAFREVSDGLAARGTYDQQIAALERNEHAQQRRYDLSDLRYRNGVDSYLSVLTAQTDLYSAQQQLISARLARWTNLVDLYRALGGGWLERAGETPRPADAPVDYGKAAPAPAASASARTAAVIG